MDRVLHEQARARDAGLAARREDTGDRAFDGVVDDAIVEHDVRRLAAELEHDGFELSCGGLIDAPAADVAAGERDLGDLRMSRQRLTRLSAETGDDVEHARRKARLFDEVRKFERGA